MTGDKEFNRKIGADRAAREIVRASGLSAAQVEEIASTAYLYSRLQATIKTRDHSDASNLLADLNGVSRRAIPAMALAAAISFGFFLYVNRSHSPIQQFSVDAYVGAGESRIDNVVFAERRHLTADEVLATIVSKDEREVSR